MPQPITIANLSDFLDGEKDPANPTSVIGGPVQTYPADRSSQTVTLLTVTTPGTTTARGAAAGTGPVFTNLLAKMDVAVFQCKVTAAATEAGDTLDVFIDLSLDLVTWFNGVHFTQLLGNGGAKTFIAEITHPTAGVANIDVTADAAAAATRNLWAPHVRVGWNNTDANANTNAIFSFIVTAYLQAK